MRVSANTVWARLIGVMALVVAPLAAVIVLVVYAGFQANVGNLRATQVAAAAGRAQALHSWLDAAGRSLANEADAAVWLDGERCAFLAAAFLRRNRGFAAVYFVDERGAACAAGEAVDWDALGAAAEAGEEGYRLAVVGGRLWIATTALTTPDGRSRRAALVVDPGALSVRLPPLPALGETDVALLAPGGQSIAADQSARDDLWAPASIPGAGAERGWRGLDRRGDKAAFVRAPLGSPEGLSVLMRFDDQRRDDARRRLVFVCAALFAMLALLGAVYAAVIRRDVVRWIRGLEAAARALSRNPESRARAPFEAATPDELRRLAEAFNRMADRISAHQAELRASLDDNRALMREMHHRIKNSLQVIQSYMALIRRAGPRADAAALLRMEARVAVLAVAYRSALTSVGIRPIAVKPFLEEAAGAAIASCRRHQRATLALAWEGELEIERAIPLGLGLVETLIAAFDGEGTTWLVAELTPSADGVDLVVTTDGAPAENQPPRNIMLGLGAQLGATVGALAPTEVMRWRFPA